MKYIEIAYCDESDENKWKVHKGVHKDLWECLESLNLRLYGSEWQVNVCREVRDGEKL